MSLQETDREAAAVAKAPRVRLVDIENRIGTVFHTTADKAVMDSSAEMTLGNFASAKDSLCLLSLCIIVMRNGFVVVGKSAPASPENFNADLGRKFAYEDAIRQLWPLEGYTLRERLSETGKEKKPS